MHLPIAIFQGSGHSHAATSTCNILLSSQTYLLSTRTIAHCSPRSMSPSSSFVLSFVLVLAKKAPLPPHSAERGGEGHKRR